MVTGVTGVAASTGAVAQVREETGVETEFVSLVCMRHNTRFVFGKSDMYVVARLRPTATTINIDPDEIADARWMPVGEFLANKVNYSGVGRRDALVEVPTSLTPPCAL